MFENKTPWVFLLLLWMGGSAYWHLCKIKQLCPGSSTETSAATPAEPTPSTPGWQLTDGKGWNLTTAGNFSFARSGAEASLNSVRSSLDSLVAYLKANPERRMLITGLYTDSEQNPSTFPNLGVARAEGIRGHLVDQGIPASRFLVQGEQDADLPFAPAGDSLYGGLRFAFLDEVLVKGRKPTTEEALAQTEKFASIFEPMDLYFNTGKVDYIQTDETRKFVAEAQEYLKQHPDKKLMVTGHTDNVGADDVNLALSKKRAGSVKDQLVKTGLAAAQIDTDGQGETQPVASNDSDEGRRVNRRATIVVKQ